MARERKDARRETGGRPGSVWKKVKPILDGLFLSGIVLIFLMGLAQTLIFPDEMSEYENRYAGRVERLTLASWLDGSFQQSMDDALGDQVTLSSTFKGLYNRLNTALQRVTSERILGGEEYFQEHYIWLDGTRIFGGDTLVYGPYPESELEKLTGRIEDYNNTFAAFPDTEFFLYYIEKDTDLDFETGEKGRFYETLCAGLTLPAERTARFQIDSFEQFRENFYQTDHHWNYNGSYRGYGQVMELLGCEDALIEPAELVTLPGQFSGSKASMSGAMYSETFSAYRFRYPAMEITVNGHPAADYGNQEGYLSGLWGTPTYGEFYGWDDGEVIFDTGRPEREDILVIGESYDNAVLKLIASHYNRTHSIDLRYYAATMGKEFSLGEYLREHEIGKVLLIGNVDFYLSPDFKLGG